jgi:DNA modification methylase
MKYTSTIDYSSFLATKRKTFIESGFEISESALNPMLKDFQRFGVKTALSKGRFAFFFDCGLGKTFCQLEWAKHVTERTGMPVLILAPLAIVQQTIDEAAKFGISAYKLDQRDTPVQYEPNIFITNYDQLKNIDVSVFAGVVLDESSILKGRDGKLSAMIIDLFKNTLYKLCCTATPSPNDHMELGQHSEFLGGMTYLEMLAMFFVHDGGETSKWRLRKHAKDVFWKYVCTWSIAIDNPATLGFNSDGYLLPEIEYIEHLISVENNTTTLFNDVAVSSTDIHKDLNRSFDKRLAKAIELVNANPNQTIVWGLSNSETDAIAKLLHGSVNVQGSDTPEYKAKHLNGFARQEFETLVTKASIASFGMNYQQCDTMVFMSYDFKFEAFYQAVRRCYRFGQQNKVTVHILIPESQLNVRATILEKERNHKEMIAEMSKYSAHANYKANKSKVMIANKEIKTSNYHLINGDCVQETKKLSDNCADIVVFSPPFAELYVYSDKEEDMGNVSNYKQFESHFKYLIPELKRTLKPGRICAIHCMDLPVQKGKEGYIGLRDFSGMITEWFQERGFIYHSRVTIWKNPVTEMQRTKALGLLHKTIKKDSVMTRVGIPDYVLFFRNEGENDTPITHQDKDAARRDYLPVDLWQKYASPVWYDIDYGRTLQYRSGRDGNDEKHICPLQIDTIERILHLYSNEGDTVLSPFGGIGSEGWAALKMNRKSISIELKESYFKINAQNHKACIEEKDSVLSLFDMISDVA